MSTSSRLTEKWINRGLWAISFIFAGFLIGLGSLVVEDLPKVQTAPTINEFVDQQKYESLKNLIEQRESVISNLRKEHDDEIEKTEQLNRNYQKSKEVFNNWIATRQTTQDNAQNADVLARTKELENQQAAIRAQEQKAQDKYKEVAKLEKDLQEPRDQLNKIEYEANLNVNSVIRWNQIKVFIYRLLVTLPLLLIAGWLFVKKRKTAHWPFIWGFIFFALYTFFIELVPYLPSYGGYVRYAVGIIVTFSVGHYSIKALQKYLEKQKIVEATPNNAKEIWNYDLAHQRFSKNICPGCERPADLKDVNKNYCIHCGTCHFNFCPKCNTRKNAFAKHCHHCGEAC